MIEGSSKMAGVFETEDSGRSNVAEVDFRKDGCSAGFGLDFGSFELLGRSSW